ncbi:OmpA family protein [Isoptericola sp. CG 20/1183]|uniref:OmpA family protein n=1 Tax=Isoptericola halotolerans TaxID=300560 RepID=A0ABX5EE41_9MICO|nr:MULTISPECIES: OmpA family protein [Isoptericola]PRZ06967.1 OmpA family protein [Isoptericola halotolerans]PRZ07361.1 OmpA family protein [Isoptericola sp. CG 20/1183]
MRRPRSAAVVAVALVVTGPAAAAAGTGTDPSSSPSPGASTPDPALVEEAAEHLAADRERIESTEVTDAMRAAAVVDLAADDATHLLRADDSTFPLSPDDATTTLESTVEEEGDTVTTLTSDLLFAFGSAELTGPARAAVAELAAQIPDGAEVGVDGHTDSIGSAADNDELSERRAKAVASVLRDERDDLSFTVRGHGEDDPVAENEVDGADNPAGRALNRRVEVTYPTS